LAVGAEHGGERRGDLEFEQHEAFVAGKTGAGVGDLTGGGVVDRVGDAVDVELVQVPGLRAGGGAVQYVAAVAAQVVSLGKAGSMNTNSRSAVTMGRTGCSRGAPSGLTVAR
jgi:hypothetical protein